MKNRKLNGYLTTGLIMAGVMLTLIVVGMFWTPYDPAAMC